MRTSGAGFPSRCNPNNARMSELWRSSSRVAATVPAATDQAARPSKDTHVHALEEGGPCAPDQCHPEHDQRDAVVGRCRRVSGHRARMCPGLTEAAAVGVALRHRSDRSPVGPATAVGHGLPARRSRRATGHYEVADVRNVPGDAHFVTAARPRTPVGKEASSRSGYQRAVVTRRKAIPLVVLRSA